MLRYFREDDDFELFCSTMYQHYPECEADEIHTCNNGSSRSRCLKRVQVGDEKQLWPKLQQSSSLIYTQAMREAKQCPGYLSGIRVHNKFILPHPQAYLKNWRKGPGIYCSHMCVISM